MIKEPILLSAPMPIRTPRLLITPAFPEKLDEYAEKFYQARIESVAELAPWMRWAHDPTSVDDNKTRLIKWYAEYIRREEFCLLILTHDGEFVGSTGIHEIKWEIPRGHIGYWCRTSMTGKGYITEVANALTRYGFEVLKLRKMTIDVDSENLKSAAVPQRLGFRHDYDDLGGITKPGTDELRIRSVYSRFDLEGLPPLEVSW